MDIFNLFRKQYPKGVYEAIAEKIVLSSLVYCEQIETTNNQYAADAGAEIAYFLLHMLDRQLFKEVGVPARDKIFDKITFKVLADYARAVLKPETPSELVLQLSTSMFHTLNERQRIYSNCKCLMTKENPGISRGSIIFALSFYIHKALRKTDRSDVDDILCGDQDISISELNDFPDISDIVKINIYAMNMCIEIAKMLKKFTGKLEY